MTTPLPGGAGEPGRGRIALPRYGESTLADLGSSLLASLGVPGEDNALGLPPSRRACLLLIDGLGWHLLAANRQAAPFLSGLPGRARLAAGFPSTTVTSLSSLGTGRPPGQHGLLGYQVRVPDTGQLLNALRWDKAVDPVALAAGHDDLRAGRCRRRRRVPGRARLVRTHRAVGGLDARRRLPRREHAGSAGRPYRAGAGQPAARASRWCTRGDLDSTGHACGARPRPGRTSWRTSTCSPAARERAAGAPRCTSPPTTGWWTCRRKTAWTRTGRRSCASGVALLGGEPRARHVYACPVPPRTCWPRWQAVRSVTGPGSSAGNRHRRGLVRPVDERVADRLGDVIAAARGTAAVVADVTEPRESRLVGMHGVAGRRRTRSSRC